MRKIELYELTDFLGYTDLKSIRNWCARNDVLIVKQGKMEFVFEPDFKLAYELPLINKLKRKFGDNWEQVYRLFADNNIPALNELINSTTAPTPIYKKNNESKNKLMQKLKDYEKKNAA